MSNKSTDVSSQLQPVFQKMDNIISRVYSFASSAIFNVGFCALLSQNEHLRSNKTIKSNLAIIYKRYYNWY
jgi:Ethanolamine utilization protein EutJ (predicted chaperonin)